MTKLEYHRFSIEHSLRPAIDRATGEPVKDEESGEQAQVPVHTVRFTDDQTGSIVEVDLQDGPRDTFMLLLAGDFLFTADGEVDEEGEAELLRRIRTSREGVMQHRQAVRAADAGLQVAQADALAGLPAPPVAP